MLVFDLDYVKAPTKCFQIRNFEAKYNVKNYLKDILNYLKDILNYLKDILNDLHAPKIGKRLRDDVLQSIV